MLHHTWVVKDQEIQLIQTVWIFLSICSNTNILVSSFQPPFLQTIGEQPSVPCLGCASGGQSSTAFARSDLVRGSGVQGFFLADGGGGKVLETSWVPLFHPDAAARFLSNFYILPFCTLQELLSVIKAHTTCEYVSNHKVLYFSGNRKALHNLLCKQTRY